MKFAFILGIHKSGTSLVRSLLEGHSQVNIVPIETHYFKHFGLPYNYPIRKSRANASINVQESMKGLMDFYVNNDNQYSDLVTDRAFDFEKFDNRVKDVTPDFRSVENLKHFYRGIFEGFGHETKEGGIYVEKSVDNLEYAEMLANMLPEAKFVHVVRNPFSNYNALKYYLSRNTKVVPPAPEIIELLKYNMKYVERLAATIPNYKLILFEELIEEPEKILKEMADFLGVEFEPSLLMPTVFGEKWSGNSTSNKQFEGISKDVLYNWQHKISKSEEQLIFNACKHFIEPYQSEKPKAHSEKDGLKSSLKLKLYNYFYKYYDHL